MKNITIGPIFRLQNTKDLVFDVTATRESDSCRFAVRSYIPLEDIEDTTPIFVAKYTSTKASLALSKIQEYDSCHCIVGKQYLLHSHVLNVFA